MDGVYVRRRILRSVWLGEYVPSSDEEELNIECGLRPLRDIQWWGVLSYWCLRVRIMRMDWLNKS